MSFALSKEFLGLDYTFVSNDPYAATALMKCELPAKAIEIHGARSQHITVKDFIEQSRKNQYDNNDVIVFLKIGNNLDTKTISEIEKLKTTVFAMFCDVNDNYEFLIHDLNKDLKYTPERALKFLKLMDGVLYESSDLKDVILKFDNSLVPMKVRHPHTNCSKSINYFSPVNISKGSPFDQLFKENSLFNKNGILNAGYLGRPKQCTDFLRLTRAIHNLGIQSRFIHANPNIETNFSITSEIDIGFALYDFDDWTRKLKPANKMLNYWSIGIPCLVSPYTSYKDVFLENNLDLSYYKIPDVDFSKYKNLSAHETSLKTSGQLTEKIRSILSDAKEFHERRLGLWNISKRYNPMNIEFLYEGMFSFIREKL